MLSYFWPFFCLFVFHHKICVFIIFISFFDEVTNFRNRILTNQKHELVVCNCQCNCILNAHFSSIQRINVVNLDFVQTNNQVFFFSILTSWKFILIITVLYHFFQNCTISYRKVSNFIIFSSMSFSCPSVTSIHHDNLLTRTVL